MRTLGNAKQSPEDSISIYTSPDKLIVRERIERFRLEVFAEVFLRALGMIMIVYSFVLPFFLPVVSSEYRMLTYGVLVGISAGAGLLVYALGSRGFRRQLTINKVHKTLGYSKINLNDQSRVEGKLNFVDIDSIFVRRPGKGDDFAGLFVRVRGRSNPFCVISGKRDELEALHRGICDIVKPPAENRSRLAAGARHGDAALPVAAA